MDLVIYNLVSPSGLFNQNMDAMIREEEITEWWENGFKITPEIQRGRAKMLQIFGDEMTNIIEDHN